MRRPEPTSRIYAKLGSAAAFALWFLTKLVSNAGNWYLFAVVVVQAFVRQVDSGFVGVVFRNGRVHRLAQPGLNWKIPFFEQITPISCQSVTMEIPAQRVELADGTVFLVIVTTVVRVTDPTRALVEVHEAFAATARASALAARAALAAADRSAWADPKALEQDLVRHLAARIAPWGLVVERAAFSRFTPDATTARLSQLALNVAERREVWDRLRGADVDPTDALALLGSAKLPMARTAWLYRAPAPQLMLPQRKAAKA